MMRCGWIRLPHWMRSSWPSKNARFKFIQTKVVARRLSIWSMRRLRPWLIQRLGRNMTKALLWSLARPKLLTAQWRRRPPPKTAVLHERMRGQSRDRPNQERSRGTRAMPANHLKHRNPRRPSCWSRSVIFCGSCQEIHGMMWLPNSSRRSNAWFWRTGWWTLHQGLHPKQKHYQWNPSCRLLLRVALVVREGRSCRMVTRVQPSEPKGEFMGCLQRSDLQITRFETRKSPRNDQKMHVVPWTEATVEGVSLMELEFALTVLNSLPDKRIFQLLWNTWWF